MKALKKNGVDKNENQNFSFLESSPDPIVIYNFKGEAEYVNLAFENTFGWKRKELIGNRIDFVPKDHLFETSKAIKKLEKGHTIRLFETKRLTKNGNLLDLQLSASTHKDEEGKPAGYIVILRDITELKRTQNALQESEDRYKILVEDSPYGISIIDSAGNYKYVNPKFIEIFGYTLEEIPNGYEWFKKAYPDEKYRKTVISIWKRDQKKFKPGIKAFYKFNVVCNDNSTKTILFRPVKLENGDIFLNYEDITQREEIQKKLNGSHTELALAYEKLHYLKSLRDKAIGHLSHELKTPISILLAVFRILRDRIDTKNLESVLNVIKRGERSISRLMKIQKKTEEIYQIKDTMMNKNSEKNFENPIKNESSISHLNPIFLQIGSKKNDEMLGFEIIHLDLFLRNLVDQSIIKSKHRDIQIIIDFEENIFIFFNKKICEELFTGVLRNAIENTPDEGKILINLSASEHTYDLEFIDYGIGITKSNQKSIFNGFFSNQNYLNYTTKSPYEFSAGGAGLDLLRMRLYAKQYGFQLDFKSERCKFIPDERDLCPGKISDCNSITKREDCISSGGSNFFIKFRKYSY